MTNTTIHQSVKGSPMAYQFLVRTLLNHPLSMSSQHQYTISKLHELMRMCDDNHGHLSHFLQLENELMNHFSRGIIQGRSTLVQN